MANGEGDVAQAPALFPATRWSRIQAAREKPELRRAILGELCATRWQPLYVILRKKGWPPDRAEDIVQGFLVHLLERDFLARLDPDRGSLRAYLKAALAHYVANLREHESALKRGGGLSRVSFDAVEARVPSAPDDPDSAYDRAWALDLFEGALTELESELASGARQGPADIVRQLFRWGEAPPYEALAAEHGMTLPQLKSFVHRARGRFRALLLARISDTVHTPQEAESELADLLRTLAA